MDVDSHARELVLTFPAKRESVDSQQCKRRRMRSKAPVTPSEDENEDHEDPADEQEGKQLCAALEGAGDDLEDEQELAALDYDEGDEERDLLKVRAAVDRLKPQHVEMTLETIEEEDVEAALMVLAANEEGLLEQGLLQEQGLLESESPPLPAPATPVGSPVEMPAPVPTLPAIQDWFDAFTSHIDALKWRHDHLEDKLLGKTGTNLFLAMHKVTSEVTLLNMQDASRRHVQRVNVDHAKRLVFAFPMRNPWFAFVTTDWEILVPDSGHRNFKQQKGDRIHLDPIVGKIMYVYKQAINTLALESYSVECKATSMDVCSLCLHQHDDSGCVSTITCCLCAKTYHPRSCLTFFIQLLSYVANVCKRGVANTCFQCNWVKTPICHRRFPLQSISAWSYLLLCEMTFEQLFANCALLSSLGIWSIWKRSRILPLWTTIPAMTLSRQIVGVW